MAKFPWIVDGKTIKRQPTRVLLKTITNEMGGENLTETKFEYLCSKYSKLQHCYCVLQDDELFRFISQPDEPGMQNRLTDVFMKSTRGGWIYITAQFLVDCYMKQELVDPAPYVISVIHPGLHVPPRGELFSRGFRQLNVY